MVNEKLDKEIQYWLLENSIPNVWVNKTGMYVSDIMVKFLEDKVNC